MDFDIEDVGRRVEYDDIIGYTDDSDLEAIAENMEINDYGVALDMFGDELSGSDQIDPLTFVPKTASDFANLKAQIIEIVNSVAVELRIPFIAALIHSLTGKFHKLQREELLNSLSHI